MYTWVPFFEELGSKLAEYENKQSELTEHLRQAGVQVAEDQLVDGTAPLADMDPFTFFSLCTKYGAAKQGSVFASLKSQLALVAPAPSDVAGVPNANALLAWFFNYHKDREAYVIPLLWRFYEQVQTNAVDDDTFAQVLALPGVGWGKLTQGIFDLQPRRYMPLNLQTRPYFERRGLPSQFGT